MDDQWPFNRKLREVEPLDRLLWVMSIPYCSSQNTDGRLSGPMLEMVAFLAGVTKPYEAADRLVAAGLFDLDAGGWSVHDYLTFNPSAAQREDISAKKAEAGRKGGYAKAGTVPANSQANSQHDAWQTSGRPVPSRPVPSTPSSSSSGPSHQELPNAEQTTDDRTSQITERLGRADHTKALADGVPIRNRQAHLNACITKRKADKDTIRQLIDQHPDWADEQVADQILNHTPSAPPARRTCTRCHALTHTIDQCPLKERT